MKKIHYSWKDIQGAVLEIARQMYQHNWHPDYIVGVTRGGAVPAVMLSQYLNIPMKPLQVNLRDHTDTVSDLGMAEDAYEGKKILIVDDINDLGSTISWIKNDWQSSCHPQAIRWPDIWGDSVRFAVLTQNWASNFKDIDYYVWQVNKHEEDCWLVYPWEEFWK